MVSSSRDVQLIEVSARPATAIPPIRQVRGETGFMNKQNLGRSEGRTSTLRYEAY